ncbi:WD-repeat region-domain-containing protein [Chlamydoabsidia padenii]|nr:WD-repeat region-domain-containing protein [Chlamydoabsidia padenii]
MVSYQHTFPLFAPADDEGQVYRGFIQIHQKEYYVEIQLATKGTAARIYGNQELQSLLSPYQSTIQGRLDQCQDIGLFLSDLKDTLEQILLPALDFGRMKPLSERYNILVNELNTIGYDQLDTMNDTMTELVFKCQDQGHRWHFIKAHIPLQFPLQPPTLTLDLPTTTSDYHSPPSALSTMLTHAIHQLDRYQSFFDTMDQLDQQARVLDPHPPLRSHHWRRIALGNHCSLQLTIQDPMQPTQTPPHVRFFGNEKSVLPYQQAWTRFLDSNQWRSDLSVLDNFIGPLPSLLRSDSISNVTDSKEDDMACAICYAYKLDLANDSTQQETPDTICTNQQLATLKSYYNKKLQYFIWYLSLL